MNVGRTWTWGRRFSGGNDVIHGLREERGQVDGGASAGRPAGKEAPAGVVTEAVKPGSPHRSGTRSPPRKRLPHGVIEEKASIFQDIRFDFDKSFIGRTPSPPCQIADYMKKNAGAKLSIEGLTSAERPSTTWPLEIDAPTAPSTWFPWRSGGRFTISFGKEKPLDPGHTEEAWAKNRRAHCLK